MNHDEMSFDSLNYVGMIRELIRHWWMIVLAMASMWLLVTGIGKLMYVPQYKVSATLVINEKGNSNTYSSLTIANQMATVIKEIFQSDALITLVEEDIGSKVNGTVSCTQVSETNLLVLTVTSDAPKDAYQYLNAALAHYNEVSDYIFSNASMQILQEPSIPTQPSNTPMLYGRRYLLALGAGAAMAALIILFYCLRPTIKTAKSAVKLLDGNIYGVIPFENKKGRKSAINKKNSLLITSSTVSMNFAEANRRMTSRVQSHMDKHHQKILLNVSVSENEGKSTIASNLTLALTERNKKVLLVDGDFRKPSLFKIFDKERLDFNPIELLLKGSYNLDEAIMENERYHFWELFIYKALSNPAEIMSNPKFGKLFEKLKESFDYIIIDCSPAAVATDAEVWMEIADCTLITVREDYADYRTINDTVDLIWQSGCNFVGFVLNSFKEHIMDKDAYRYSYYQKNSHSGKQVRYDG